MNKLLSKQTNDVMTGVLNRFGTLMILLVMLLIMTCIKGTSFLSVANLFNIIRQQSIIALISLGVMFCIITAGIDISSGSVIAFCGCVVASLAHPVAGDVTKGQFPLIVPILGGILTGALCGLINGLFIAYGRVPPFIVTLGMMTTTRGMALIISGGRPINGFTSSFDFIGRGSWLGIPVPIYILAAGTVIMFFILHRSKFGVYVYAIGGNINAANVSGIKVRPVTVMVYVLAGMFTGIASLILTSRTLAGNPGTGQGYEMDAITGAVIGGVSFSGGVGRVINTLIGAFIMGVLTNSMTMLRIEPYIQMVVRGLVIVFAVLIDARKHRRT
jgi:ribose/xylose/arabinose/galactoside ABC-type transport system permease subunit